ncbi:hypothetical protein BEP19_08750 [Ammoniphilus oxalaticus]|uniref:Uncharacterized protein n=1 Tax=Ammoniphilus oxalaticus TaxID=66863 RepID=A0A419SKK4_9BACL|nr:hypothetical protein [Ammoniphilus oxalaticus]RKD24466.1 hypothetical protein BEP19_08750 [Ammoniphilus oxalaticus]
MSYKRTITPVDGHTVVYNYAHETQTLPFRVEIKRMPNETPEFGNFFKYQVTELNLGIQQTVSQGILNQAIQYFGQDADEIGQQVFVDDAGFINSQEQMDKVMLFNNANPDYKKFKIESAGLAEDEVDDAQWMEALLADFTFFMAQTLLHLYMMDRQQAMGGMG